MTLEDLEGYALVEDPERGVTLVIAAAAREKFLASGLCDPEQAAANLCVTGWTRGGRVPHPVYRVDGERWVAKSYRRGGFLSHWNQDLYLNRDRFLREIEVCALAVRVGVPTVPPIAWVLKRNRLGLCRAWLISDFVDHSFTLADYLSDRRIAATVASRAQGIFRSAGQVVRRMHRARIDHQDLNLGNLLVRDVEDDDAGSRVLIIDWDRARIVPDAGGTAVNAAFKNLLRLYRSALKLHADPELLTIGLRSFLRGYFRDDAPGLRRLRRYYARRKFTEIILHRLFWTR